MSEIDPAGSVDWIDQVRDWPGAPTWKELNSDRLQSITAEHGIDIATALLFRCLRESSIHGPFIRALESCTDESLQADVATRVAVVPGGCHEESADSRTSLQTVCDRIKRSGVNFDIVPVESFGDVRRQADRIAAWLMKRTESTTLVSLSKGSAEVKLAMSVRPEAFAAVTTWVNVSGLVFGSQWVQWLLNRPISHVGARCWCWYWRYRFATLQQLTRGAGAVLDGDIHLPEHLRAVHILGFPLSGRLSHPYTRRSFSRLTHCGPNDGMGLMLGDVVRLPGVVYPVWDADHFLRSGEEDVGSLVQRVLSYLASN